MAGLNSLMNIGTSALLANQVAINVTGSNIANVDTEGYSRQTVLFQDLQIHGIHIQGLGNGVEVEEIYRNFDRFVENSYLEKFSEYSRWNEQATILQSVESIFNESNSSGISSALGAFFTDWNDLTNRPDDMATRESLLANAETLNYLINSAKESLTSTQNQMDSYIEQTVRDVNDLLESIHAINDQIGNEYNPGINNINALLDERDQLVRQLSELIDLDIQDNGPADFTIRTSSGLPLLERDVIYSLEVEAYRIENYLSPESEYTGSMSFMGTDSHEYTFEIVTPPTDTPAPGTQGSMRVSLDGGRTWLRDDDGSELHVLIPTEPDATIKVKDLEVAFTADPTQLSSGDRFEIVPKSGLYWNSPTRDPLNITPQVLSDGTDNGERLTGGTLAAYYSVRDHNVGRFIDKLDAFAETLIWEVNNIHSQGASTDMTHALGTYQIDRMDVALGSDQSGLSYNDKLTNGNLSFQIYDDLGEPLPKGTPPNGIPESLDFDTATPGIQSFDPNVHSMDDLITAINDPVNGYGEFMHASMVDGKLQLTAEQGYSFAAAADTTGLLAGLGINTFFQGENASTLSMNAHIVQDVQYINAGRVNSNGQITEDNSLALDMFSLSTKDVAFSTSWENTSQTLGGYYGVLVGFVGADTRSAMTNQDYTQALSTDLEVRAASISGVNLDEEMASLIKFQHSYTAAAKLITTADQMMQVLLGLKQ